MDPIDYITRQPHNNYLQQSLMCKQELEAENLHFMHSSDQFIQLPQLESPSLPLMKRPSSVSLISESNHEEELEQISNKKVTDWRALDKFVASQLSQGERYEGDGGASSFGMGSSNLEMAAPLLLLQSGRDEGDKLSGFLSSSSDCDFGICIFDK